MKKSHARLGENAPEVEAISLTKAYNILSQEAFAVWMKLHVLNDDILRAGRGKISSHVNYSESRFNVIVSQLVDHGFVMMTPAHRPGLPTKLDLLRVCSITGLNRFVKLHDFLSLDTAESSCDSQILFATSDGAETTHTKRQKPAHTQQRGVTPNKATHRDPGHEDQHDYVSLKSLVNSDPGTDESAGKNTQQGEELADADDLFDELDTIDSQELQDSPPFDSSRGASFTAETDLDSEQTGSPSNYPKRVKFLVPGGGLKPRSERGDESDVIVRNISLSHKVSKDSSSKEPRKDLSNSKIDLSKYSKEERRKTRSQKNKPLHPSTGKPMDWTRLDQTGKPQITFSPGDEERQEMVHILTSDSRRLSVPQRKTRKAMEAKLEQEFIRIYERYRKDVLRSDGRSTVAYGVMAGERKYARSAAISCIVKGVTPRQVLEYWHYNIKNFADCGMPVPPLTFLHQPSNIDTVSLAVMSGSARGKKPKKDKKFSNNTLGDTSVLDRNLRGALTAAGFDTTELNDVYLTTLEGYARDIANKHATPNLIPASMREMTVWCAENFLEPDENGRY